MVAYSIRSCLAIIALALVVSACQEDEVLTPQSELLDNIEFELGAMSPEAWSPVDPFASELFSFEWSKDEALSGERSLKISADSANLNDFGYWVSAIQFDTKKYAGQELELSVWAKGRLAGQGLAIVLRGNKEGSENHVSFTSSIDQYKMSGEFEWTKFVISDDILSEVDSYSIFLVLANNTIGEVYFDSVSLRKK